MRNHDCLFNTEVILVSEEKLKPILFKNKKDCCGCTACCAICPKDAITMVEDEEGFEYPQINADKCVCCYQCVHVCPIKTANVKK